MTVPTSTVWSRIRRPEYTGENRCTPCTILNLGIAGGIAGLVSMISIVGGVLLFGICVLLIYLRGYLMPGTPALTARYFPNRLLALFGKSPAETVVHDGGVEVSTDGVTPDDIESMLTTQGIVKPCADADLCLQDAFAASWKRRIEQVRDTETARNRFAMILNIDPADVHFESADARFSVEYTGDTIATWESEAAFLADIAVESTLAEWLPGWQEYDEQIRTQILSSMRVFLEWCPGCDGRLETSEDVIQTCCGPDTTNVIIECVDCGVPIFEGRYR